MLRLRGLCVLLVAFPVVGAKAPIRHEDVWLMKRVGAPAVSPDGRWVVFAVTEPAYDEKDQASDLWSAPVDGSAKPRRLTATKGGESGAAWSPDSRKIAFSAKREGDEAAQIYVLDLAGGEAVRVTSLATGAAAPKWRPDGKAVLFTSAVYPGGERPARKYSARVFDGYPIRYWDRWLDERRTHLFVQDLEPGAKPKDLLAGTKLAAEPGFGGAPSLTGTEDELDPVWSPDGKSIVFAASLDRHASAYAFATRHLYEVPAAGGEPRALTSGAYEYAKPAFGPEGRTLYALREAHRGKVYNANGVVRLEWPPAGEPRLLTAEFDRSVTTYAVQGRTVWMLAEEAGHEKLFSIAGGGGVVRPALDVTQGVYTNLAAAEKALVANWESAVSPAEVVRIDTEAKTHRALSDFNAARAAEIDWQPLRHFWFTSKQGKRIHNLIALPPGFDPGKKYPLFVVMHGGPNNMWRDYFFVRWNYHLLAAPGYVVLLTNYTGSTGFGEKFAQEIEGDPFATPASEINQAADEAARQFPFIDGTRAAAGGASYGGSLANWMLATTSRYKCLINHAGIFNLESMWGTTDIAYWLERRLEGPAWEQAGPWRQQNPVRLAAKFQTPMLVSHGENDFRVPLNQALELWSVLQRLRVPSRLVVYPGENHWVMSGENSRFFYQEAHAWLAKHLQ
jgi:dipeptidyl aminopeptidase/acylaminoacyl peptidase